MSGTNFYRDNNDLIKILIFGTLRVTSLCVWKRKKVAEIFILDREGLESGSAPFFATEKCFPYKYTCVTTDIVHIENILFGQYRLKQSNTVYVCYSCINQTTLPLQ